MKTILFLMTTFIASLSNQTTIWEPEPHTPLSKVEIPVGEQPYFALTIKGINATMVRTSEKAIRVELFAEASTDKSPVSQEAFFKEHTFGVNQAGHSIEAQLNIKPGVNTPVNVNKWLVIYLPRTQRFHLETAHKMYFGAGFPDLHDSYSGTADFGPDDSIPNTRGFHNPAPETSPEGKKTDSGASKKSGETKRIKAKPAVINRPKENLIKVDAAEVIAKLNRGEAVAYKNAVIEGHLDMTQLDNKKRKPQEDPTFHTSTRYVSTVTAPVNFVNCIFRGKVLGYYNPDNFSLDQPLIKSEDARDGWMENIGETAFNTNFAQDVRFENCTFEQGAAFKYSEFNGKVNFAGSKFLDVAIFKYTKLEQGPDFSKAIFREAAVFKYVKFPKNTNYSQVTFNDITSFKYAEFLAGVNFQQTAFPGYADFGYAKLSQPQLQGATFKGSQDFKYTEVDGRKINLSELVDK